MKKVVSNPSNPLDVVFDIPEGAIVTGIQYSFGVGSVIYDLSVTLHFRQSKEFRGKGSKAEGKLHG